VAVKVTLLFSGGDQDGGWSEVYYVAGSDVNSGLQAAQALIPVRLRILSPDNACLGARITQPLAPPGAGFLRAQRAAYLYSQVTRGSAGGFGFPSSDVLWTGVMLRLNDVTLSIFKNQVYRGVPDSYWANGTSTGAVAAMAIWMPAWLAVLTQVNATIRHLTRPATTTFSAIRSLEYIRVSRRATGRAFGLLRGRR
jgi:hypothetical protein